MERTDHSYTPSTSHWQTGFDPLSCPCQGCSPCAREPVQHNQQQRWHTSRRERPFVLTCPTTTVHVLVGTIHGGPVHGLQRLALCSAFACAKVLERVPAARVFSIRELVHAIAGLQVRWRSTQHTRAPNTACKRQWIGLPASAPPHPATAHGRQQQATIPAKGGLPQPARTAQLPFSFAQKVTMHLLGFASQPSAGR